LEPLTRALLGHVLSRVGCCSLGLVASGSFVLVLHASGRCDKMILVRVASVLGIFPNSVVTTERLF
jgi:hypothetical protein